MIMLIYLAQFLIIVIFPLVYKGEVDTYSLILAVSFVVTLIVGLVAGFSFDKIGNEFAKGISGMAFVAFVIGLGRTLSLILVDGHIIDSIVYTLTQPLMHVSSSVTTVSITGLVALFDLVIPSNTSKAAILIPILKPVSEALNIHPTIIVQAFQYGDAFTNMVTPVLGWMIGSCMTAGVPFQKWLRWVLPKVIVFLIVSFVIIIVMTTVNYVAF
ncbi:AbgT family transporter [Enterococcus faecium]|uniref:AbgT family transporter n=1 Tax=Enterococcus faecium TaxID=1352 RepID=UPI0023E2E361|nr:AbgT family transporter [Enterococcus faecium]